MIATVTVLEVAGATLAVLVLLAAVAFAVALTEREATPRFDAQDRDRLP